MGNKDFYVIVFLSCVATSPSNYPIFLSLLNENKTWCLQLSHGKISIPKGNLCSSHESTTTIFQNVTLHSSSIGTLLAIKGQKLDDGQNGITSVAKGLWTFRWCRTQAISSTGGSTRQFSDSKHWTKKSTPALPGFQSLEKKFSTLAL